MSAEQAIFDVISERGEITLPELQIILSLPYKTVREGLNELVKKKAVTFSGGMTFRLSDEARVPKVDTGKVAPMNGKLRRIRDEMYSDTAIMTIVKYYTANPEEPVRVNKLQLLLKIGYVRATAMLEHCIALGIFSPLNRFALAPEEIRALTQARPRKPLQGPGAPSEGMMTPDEYAEYLHKRFHSEDDSAHEAPGGRDGHGCFPDRNEEIKRTLFPPEEDAPTVYTYEDDDFSAAETLSYLEEMFEEDDDGDIQFDPEGDKDDSADDPTEEDEAATAAAHDELSERLREARERLMKRLEEIRRVTDDEPALPNKKKKKKKP